MSRRPIQFLLLALILAASPAGAAGLEEHMQAVEKIRGLSFSGPVRSVTIDRSELPDRLRDQLTRTLPYSIDQWAEILEVLLLIEGERDDSFDRLIDLYESQVLAYYDPDSRTFYALAQPPPALQNLPEGMAAQDGVIVHELMHALQDQHHEIGALHSLWEAGRKHYVLRQGRVARHEWIVDADFFYLQLFQLFNDLVGGRQPGVPAARGPSVDTCR